MHVISSRQQATGTRDAESSARLLRVADSVGRLDAALLRREWPMWVQMHTLMLLDAAPKEDVNRCVPVGKNRKPRNVLPYRAALACRQ